MKKLMIAAAIVCAAAFAQAAQVSWSASKIAPVTDATYSGYLVDVTGLTSTYKSAADVVAALVSGDYDFTVLYIADNSKFSYKSQSETYSLLASKQTALAGDANKEVDYYAIIFDKAAPASAEKYMVLSSSDAATHSQFSNGGLLTVSHGDSSAKTWTNVPEPTSGLLLLLGVAGLALRRRHA